MTLPAVFLDRDGTLMEEVHYCADPALVRVFPGTVEALAKLKSRGFLLVIITNQSGIGRGLLTETQYHAVQAELIKQLDETLISASYFCPEAPPTPSPRRKPETGMVMEAVRDWDIDLARSWFVGDKAADIECGRRAGTRTVLVKTGYGSATLSSSPACSADFLAKDVVAATEIILQNCDA